MFFSWRKKFRKKVFILPAGPSTLTHLDWPSIQSKAESAPSCHPRSSQQSKRQRYQDDQALSQSQDSSMLDSKYSKKEGHSLNKLKLVHKLTIQKVAKPTSKIFKNLKNEEQQPFQVLLLLYPVPWENSSVKRFML